MRPDPLRFAGRALAIALVGLATLPGPAQPVHGIAPRARLGPRELGRQLADAVDVGDAYPGPAGRQRLWRLPGLVAAPVAAGEDPVRRWSAPGRALAGYELQARPARGLAIFAAPPAEKRRQRVNPQALRQLVPGPRSSRAGSPPLNPVFVDPQSGLRVLVTERVIVGLKAGVDARRYFGPAWKQARQVWGVTDQFVLTLPGATAEEVLAEASRRAHHAEVDWAEPDFIRQAILCSTPNDPYFAQQWHLNNTGQGGGRPGADAKLPAAWDITPGSSNILVAVLDDGAQIAHPDLAPNLFLNAGEIPGNGIDDDHNGLIDDFHGYSFYGSIPDASPVDPEDSHGTSVCGIAVGAGNNGLGIAGAAYGCSLLPLKIIEGEYLAPYSDVAAALRYAAGLDSSGTRRWRGADVLNMSLSFSVPSFTISTALSDVATRGRNGLGCGIFAAAGNSAAAWQPYEMVVDQPGAYTLRWQYDKDGTAREGDDTVWLDGITYPDGTTESFQAGGLPDGWVTSPSAPWVNVQDGVNGNRALTGWNGSSSRSLRAGAIGNNQSSYVQVDKNLTAGVLRFWVWVSSEYTYDFFRFIVNDVEIFSDSGVPLTETGVSYPASHPACFAVGASTDFDFRSDYSQYGVALDFLAPSDGGVSTILTTDRTGFDGYHSDVSPLGDYAFDFGGTSAASPLGCGVAALVLSANPFLTAAELRTLLRGTCDRVGGVSYDSAGRNYFYGSGRLNAGRAVNQALANLRVTVTPSAPLANAGDVTTYTVAVQNLGPSRSGPVTLTNQLPGATAFASATPAPASRSGARLVFSAPALAAGASNLFKVSVTNLAEGTNQFLAGALSEVLESDRSNNTGAGMVVVYPTPVISVSDAAVAEGDRGLTNAIFNVTLSNPSASVVSVGYSTVTNTAGAGSDYRTARGVLSFTPGETLKSIAVRVVGDARNEADETFLVVLTNAAHAALGRAAAVGTILNDDALPLLSITNATVTEGNSGARKATFKVRLSAPSGRLVTVDYATASGSARAGADFMATNGTLTFLPGKTTLKVAVLVLGDLVQESNLTFAVNLSNPLNAEVAQGQGIGTIRNNDKPPKLFINDVTVAEGDAGETAAVLTLRLSLASGLPVTVGFTTTNGSAMAGADYTATNGWVTFAPGETNVALPIPVLGDQISEGDEVFGVLLFGATNAVVSDPLGRVTIIDDDSAMSGSVSFQPAAGVAPPALVADLAGGLLRLRFPTVAGQHYSLEWSEDPGPGGRWRPVAGGEKIPGTGGTVEVCDPVQTSPARCFYRLRLLADPTGGSQSR